MDTVQNSYHQRAFLICSSLWTSHTSNIPISCLADCRKGKQTRFTRFEDMVAFKFAEIQVPRIYSSLSGWLETALAVWQRYDDISYLDIMK